MKPLVSFFLALALVSAADAPAGAPLAYGDSLELCRRITQLIEATALPVPGLTKAAEPVLEGARQALAAMELTTVVHAGLIYSLLKDAKAYQVLAQSVRFSYDPLAQTRAQQAELRSDIERLEAHLRALIDAKDRAARNPDRDNLARYAAADAAVSPRSSEARVVFLGDSITDSWKLGAFFPKSEFINRGISGQISAEMLGRMQADVLDLQPTAVIVLAGTNDIARGVPLKTIQNNLTMIADLAEAHSVTPLFASLLPISDYHKDRNPQYERSKQRPPASILEMNRWLRDFCEQRKFVYIDYFAATVDKDGYLRSDLAEDGLHPNENGYHLMAQVVAAGIGRALAASAAAPPAGKPRRVRPPKPEPPVVVSEARPPAPTPRVESAAERAEEAAAAKAKEEQRAAQAAAAAEQAKEREAARMAKEAEAAKAAELARAAKAERARIAQAAKAERATKMEETRRIAEAERAKAEQAAAARRQAETAAKAEAKAAKPEPPADAKVPWWKRRYPETPEVKRP